MSDEHPNQDTIDGLRKFCDWLEANPQPKYDVCETNLQICPDAERFSGVAKSIGGKMQKRINGDLFCLDAELSAKVKLAIVVKRDAVCERVKVGERVIPAQPEVELPAKVIPAKAEVIEEIYEWKCAESIFTNAKQRKPSTTKEIEP